MFNVYSTGIFGPIWAPVATRDSSTNTMEVPWLTLKLTQLKATETHQCLKKFWLPIAARLLSVRSAHATNSEQKPSLSSRMKIETLFIAKRQMKHIGSDKKVTLSGHILMSIASLTLLWKQGLTPSTQVMVSLLKMLS